MGSKESVRVHTDRVRAAKTVEQKLDALADALDELTDFVDDLENQLGEIEEKVE
jgi:prefoldin subunit 5